MKQSWSTASGIVAASTFTEKSIFGSAVRGKNITYPIFDS